MKAENLANEIRLLRGCINDLVSALALPAMWKRSAPIQIVETLLDALLGMLRLDFNYIQLNDVENGSPVEVVRISQGRSDRHSEEVRRAVKEFLGGDAFASPRSVPDPIGEGEIRIASFSLGLEETGILLVASKRADFPTETEVLLLRVAANQAAIALQGAQFTTQRKRAEERLQEQTEVVETINRIGQTLSAELDQQKLVQALTDAATELTSAAFGAYFYNVIDRDGESYMLYTLSGVPRRAFAHFPMPRATDLFGPTFRGEGVLRIADVKKDPRYGKNSPYYGMPAGHLPVTSYLAVPVKSRSGEVLGGLFFGHPNVGVFTDRHERIIVGLAAQAAVALDNARLFELAQRERAEADAARAQVDSILESITDSFSVYDREWRVTYLNSTAENLLARIGLTRAEILGKKIWDIFPELRGSETYEKYHRAVAEQLPIQFEIFFPPLDGWYEIRAYPSRDGLAVYSQDITERKRAEEALRASENQLRLVTDNIPVFIVYCDTEERYQFVNRGYAHRFNSTPSEMLGKCIAEVLGQQGYSSVQKYVAEVLHGKSVEFEEAISYESIGRHHMHCVYVPDLDENGKAKGFFALISDITERKRDEEERERLLKLEQALRAEAEQSNRLKDEFLATVSHELRTPLNSMLGWTRLLREGKLDPPSHERALETIERNAKSQAQLIEDLLDVSRIIKGNMRLEVQSVDLIPVIETAINSVRPAAEAKTIELNVVLDPDAGPVSGDPTRLLQIVWNLLSNAIKFTPKFGRVQVRLARINSLIEITVSDTGVGISPEFLPFAFDRFRQADSKLTRSHPGLGLGLAIVRHLVDLHGGSINAYSAGEGHGASFTIQLPLLAVRDVELRPASVLEKKHPTAWPDVPIEYSTALNGLRVLVVEDESDSRQLMTTILERCNASVTAVASVAEALVALEQLTPDILVSDIQMPGEDGYSFIRKVRAREARQNGRIPAAALTAHAGVVDRMRALAAGFDIHVPKPVEPAELVAVIASLANRTRKYRESQQVLNSGEAPGHSEGLKQADQ
ncbi:MAG: PAS domain-containing protein [Pyrinomonadaceae bacterium]